MIRYYLCNCINELRAMEIVWDAMHKLYVRYSFLKLLVQSCHCPNHHRICLVGSCINGEKNSFLIHSILLDWLGHINIIEKGF